MFKKINLTNTQIIALGYFAIIFLGSLLLCLPIASKERIWTPFINSLFTATSATCVTGLIVYDTFIHWSVFGQIIILIMIQIGGIGFMTIITQFAFFFKRQIKLHERKLLMQSVGSLKIGGIVILMKKIINGTLICEGAGTVLLAIRFCPQMGFGKGLYYALFHSVSAFCNAGFDLMGVFKPYNSLIAYSGDVLVNLTISFLIVSGGIGFLVWNDIITHKFRFNNYQLHSKIVLITTSALILVGTVLFFIFERNSSMSNMSVGERILASLFQAITPRTAGFNTIDLAALSESGSTLTVILMFIGGSPGSTAGGIKTTTFVVLLLGIAATVRRRKQISVLKHNLEDNVLFQASAISMLYMAAVCVSAITICAMQPFTFRQVLFEVVSAIATVGLSMGITSSLNVIAKLIIILLMYGGRVGGLSLVLAFAEKRENIPLERPLGKIIIG